MFYKTQRERIHELEIQVAGLRSVLFETQRSISDEYEAPVTIHDLKKDFRERFRYVKNEPVWLPRTDNIKV